MRPCLLLFLVLIFWENGFAQCDSLYFRNTGTLIFDLVLLDTNKVVAVGDDGYVIKSADGGKSWRNVPTFQPHFLKAIYCATDSVLYAVGDWKTILKSEDQGETWFPLYAETTSTYSSTTASLNDVFFFTKDRGFIVGAFAVLYSTKDGGRSWKDTSFSTGVSSNLNCITFVNDTLGFIGGGASSVFRTRNGGASWEKINIDLQAFNKNITKIKFLDALTGFAIGDNGTCLKTIDGGSNWTQITTPTTGSYRDIDFLDAQTGFIVGTYSEGIVLKTTNGGNTWNLEGNSFAPISSGYAIATDKEKKKAIFAGGGAPSDVIGYNGRNMISTSDRGVSYQQLSANAKVDYHDVFFINDSTGFLAGDAGTFFKTYDYGESWKPLSNIPTLLGGNSTRCLFFLNEQEGYAASDRLYKTTDGGLSWNLTAIPGGDQQVFINRMYFRTSQEGVVMDNYHIYQTTDGGATWNTAFTASSILRDMCFIPGGKGFAVGYDGTSFVSQDQGSNWSALPISTTDQFTGVYFYNSTTGFIGTADSVLYKTTDGGTTWTWLNSGIHRTEMRSFKFENDSLGYMMCNNNGGISAIYKTKNGGQTWQSERGVIENLTRLNGFKNIYIAGGNGFIAKTDHPHAPNIPGYIYGPDVNCQNKRSEFNTGALSGVNFAWTLSGGGNQIFKQNLDTVQWNTAGNFVLGVTVSNVCGTGPAREIAIKVNEATAITTQPAAQSVCKSTPAKFTVVARGTSLHYQWQKSGTDIQGATDSTLTIPVADSIDAGYYSVVVTGLCGALTSASAKLTVLGTAACTTAVTPVNPIIGNTAIIPDPVLTNATLKITATRPMVVEFEMTDMNGKVIVRFVKYLARGENKFDLNSAHLAPGIYHICGHSSTGLLPIAAFVKL